MNTWVRLYHDTPSDPKWRTIARKSGQRIGDVIAVWTFILTNASANGNERGRTHNIDSEDIATALDIQAQDVDAILAAMEGKVIESGKLTGWEKRNPINDDGGAERAKAWRERKRTETNGAERNETLDKIRGDKNREEKKVQERASDGWPSQAFDVFWDAYPHKVGKKFARKAFETARKSAVPWPTLMGALGRYKSDKPPDRQWCNPATWLNEGRWDDQPAQVTNGKSELMRAADRVVAGINSWPFEIGGGEGAVIAGLLPQGGGERPGNLHDGDNGDPFGVRAGSDRSGDGPKDWPAKENQVLAKSG